MTRRSVSGADEKALRAFLPLLPSLARTVCPSGSADWHEEMVAEARFAVAKMLPTFDAGRGVPLRLYLTTHARYAMREWLRTGDTGRIGGRSVAKEKRYAVHPVSSCSDDVQRHVATLPGPSDVQANVLEREEARRILQLFHEAGLNQKERRFLTMDVVYDVPARDIARAVGSTPTAVQTVLKTARRKFRAVHLPHGTQLFSL